MKARVAVVGSVNLDLVVTVPRLPTPGETVLGGELAFRPGGKGGNQAVAATRMGADVVLFAAWGDDAFGADLRAALRRERLDLTNVAMLAGVGTGVAMIVVAPEGQNMITVAPGANLALGPDQLGGLPEALTACQVLLLQGEIPLRANLAAARSARDAGVPIVLNAAPMPDPGPELAELLRAVDVLVVNESEALRLSGAAEPADPDGWSRLAGSLRGHGPRVVVITLGARGAVAATDAGVLIQPSFAVDAVDGTGAGDAFCGALAVELAESGRIGPALARACASGALATTRVGAQAALPDADEVDRLLASAAKVS